MIDPRLKTFLTLYKSGSYTKASEKLFISQPSVTNHIKSLEKEFNTTLFLNENKKLKLTKAGEVLLEYANRETNSYNRFVKLIAEANMATQDISFATKSTISEFFLPEALIEWSLEHPESRTEVKIKQEKDMFEALDSGEVSFVITDQMIDKRINRYCYEHIKTQHIILVVGKDHRLAGRESIMLKDLEDEKWLLTGSNSKYKSLKHKFMLHNLNIKNIVDFTKIENENVIKSLVQKNVGITFVTKDFVKKELEEGSLIEVKIRDFNIMKELVLVYIEDSNDKDTIIKFLDCLKKYVGEDEH